MTGQDAQTPLDELNTAKHLRNSRELHALLDMDKLGFEIDQILPLGTTGYEVSLINTTFVHWLKFSTGTKGRASSMEHSTETTLWKKTGSYAFLALYHPQTPS